jgi:hypothetical protein
MKCVCTFGNRLESVPSVMWYIVLQTTFSEISKFIKKWNNEMRISENRTCLCCIVESCYRLYYSYNFSVIYHPPHYGIRILNSVLLKLVTAFKCLGLFGLHPVRCSSEYLLCFPPYCDPCFHICNTDRSSAESTAGTPNCNTLNDGLVRRNM